MFNVRADIRSPARSIQNNKRKLTFLWGLLPARLSLTNQPVLMAEDHIWNLIAKKLSGEATEPELREFEKLLRENPELHYPVQTIMDLWSSDMQFDQQEAHEAFNSHVERMEDLKIDFKSGRKDQLIKLRGSIKNFLCGRLWLLPFLSGSYFWVSG